MSDGGLFREEALRRWRQGGIQGEVLRLAPRWTRWACLLLLLCVIAGGIAAAFVTLPLSVQGPAAVTTSGRVLVLLPARHKDQVASSAALFYQDDAGGAPVRLRIDRIEPGSLSREEARALAGGVFSTRAVPDVSVVALASTPGAAIDDTGRGRGTATVPLGRERLLDIVRPGRR